MNAECSAAECGQTLKKHLPFGSDYSRVDAIAYEPYRRAAISMLMRLHELSTMRAHCIVDDAIAEHERLNPGMMTNKKDDS